MNNCYCENMGANIVLFCALVSATLGRDLTTYQQDALGNFFLTIGQNLTAMAAISNDCQEMMDECNNNDLNTNDLDKTSNSTIPIESK